MPLIADKLALVDDTILTMNHLSMTVTLVFAPHTSVLRFIIWPVHGAHALPKAIFHLAFVAPTVCPYEDTITADSILVPLAFVRRAVRPGDFTQSLSHVCYPLAFVYESITCDDAPMSMALIVFEIPSVRHSIVPTLLAMAISGSRVVCLAFVLVAVGPLDHGLPDELFIPARDSSVVRNASLLRLVFRKWSQIRLARLLFVGMRRCYVIVFIKRC